MQILVQSMAQDIWDILFVDMISLIVWEWWAIITSYISLTPDPLHCKFTDGWYLYLQDNSRIYVALVMAIWLI